MLDENIDNNLMFESLNQVHNNHDDKKIYSHKNNVFLYKNVYICCCDSLKCCTDM